MGRSAAGEELAGAHAAGESLKRCRFMRQDRKRGRNLIKDIKKFKTLFLHELNGTAGTICGTRCAAFKNRVNIFLVIMCERLWLCFVSTKSCAAAINTNTDKSTYTCPHREAIQPS